MTTEASGGVTQIPKKNYIINPTFSINQRGFAGGALSATAYGWDRWLSNGGAGNFTLLNGEVTIGAGDELQQRIESSQIPTGTVCTLSWEGTSLGYPAVSQGYTTTGHTSPYSFTMIQEDESGAGIGEYITFKEGTVKNPKLELGSVVTPFEIPDIATELAKCQRYYNEVTTGNVIWSGDITNGNGYLVTYSYPVEMRVKATVVLVNTGSSGFTGTITEDATRSTTKHLVAVSSANATKARGYFAFTYTADAEL